MLPLYMLFLSCGGWKNTQQGKGASTPRRHWMFCLRYRIERELSDLERGRGGVHAHVA